jgi:hypothetical protein
VAPVIAYHPSTSHGEPAFERRKKRRIPTNDPAMLRILGPGHTGQRLVRILDVSEHGLKITSSEALPPGTIVHIRMEGSAVVAEVRHCSVTQTGFTAGLRVDSITPVS